MRIWKRAWLHTVRKKGKTALMFLILLTIATLILTCLAIRSATDTAALNIRKSLMGGFTVNGKHLDSFLDESAVLKILEQSGMRDQYNLRSYGLAEYRNLNGQKLKTIIKDGTQASKDFEHAGKLISATHSDLDTYFTEAGFELIEGRHITAGDKNAVIVSDEFARMNGLKLGDPLLLGDLSSDKETKAEIVGTFKPKKEMESKDMAPPEEWYENICFADDETYSRLTFDSGNHYQYGDFYVDDPAQLDSILEKVKAIPGMDWEKCTFTKNDADYLHAKTELQALQNLVTVIVLILIAVSVAMLALILLLWVRARIQEIGMLLAMGIGKGNIILQHIAELLLIAIFAFALSFAASSLIAQQVGDTLMVRAAIEDRVTENDLTDGTSKEQETDKSPILESIDISVSASDLLLVYGIGTGMILLSVALASYPILRLKPKEILTKMS